MALPIHHRPSHDQPRPRGRRPNDDAVFRTAAPPTVSTYLLGCMLLAGCAPDLRLPVGEPSTLSQAVRTSPGALGEFVTVVDASDRERWVYFSFEQRAEVAVDGAVAAAADAGEVRGTRAAVVDAATSPPPWDLAFQRFQITTNGGVTGDGGVGVAVLADTDFDGVDRAPSDGYVEDAPDGTDADANTDTAFSSGEGWYAYDSNDNSLSPRNITFVVRATGARHYKLRLLSYYSEQGSAAHPSFRWAELAAR